MVHDYLFARGHQRISKKAGEKANPSSMWQQVLSHIGSNEGIFVRPKHQNEGSSDLQTNNFFLFQHIKNKLYCQQFSTPEETLDTLKTHDLELLSGSEKSASKINSNGCKSV